MYGIVLFLVATSYFASGQLQCRDENGKPVDWYVMYKLPILPKQRDILLRRGLGYVYMTSDNDSEWKFSKKSINDTNSIPGRTLAPLYDSTKNLFHILYNDDPPNMAMSLYWGHTKGVVLFNGKEGLWLIHSSPRFPIEPVTEKIINGTKGPETITVENKYFYPTSAVKFGQSFLCISLPASQMNALGVQLMYNRPRIYSAEVPESIKSNFRNLTLAAEKEYVRKAPWFNKISLKSKGGVEFISFAKARQFNKELYSDWVASDLQSDMMVETWSNGAGELPSNCKNKFQVLDVKEVSVILNQNEDTFVKFKNSQDHSKWAVTSEQNNSVVCIGDINRMRLGGIKSEPDDPNLKGLRRYFNSITSRGRANTAKATYLVTLIGLSFWYWKSKSNNKTSETEVTV